METIFPTSAGYAGVFLVGFRKNNNGMTERTGTVILKRAYDIDPIAGTLAPAPVALPIFMQDQPDNLVSNSDFELSANSSPSDWEAEAATIALATGQGVSGNALQVTGLAHSRVIQTLTFEKPLGGRQFMFSFYAKSDPLPARIENVQLEADGSAPICVVNTNLAVGSLARLSAVGIWPANLGATNMRVVLRMATEAARTVYYDEIQVEERDFLTVWNPKTVLRYEHDFVAFKPQGDVIVLDFTGTAGVNHVCVNGTAWLERTVGNAREKAMFGWEPRVGSTREGEAGTFPGDPEAYPLSDPLPVDFNNLFYNGYLRSARLPAELPYLPSDAQIRIERATGAAYMFALPEEGVSATYYYYNGIGPDAESNWQSQIVEMNLDTLVIEPEVDRCYTVWRGVWPFDLHPDHAYRRLIVSATS